MSCALKYALALGLALATTPALADSAPNRDSLSAEVDAAIRQQMTEQRIPGISLAVVRNGKIIKATGYGLANLEVRAPVTPETIFEAGSITKQFAATAIMLLAEEGKISLDASITKYFPEAPPTMKAVTVRHLLTHTSGIPDVDGSLDATQVAKAIVDLHREYTEDELARAYLAQPLDFQPGTKWSYCNVGYELLGFLIHRVTGRYYVEFLRERIFAPLGMSTTRVRSYAEIIPHRASGYDLINGAWKNTPRWQSESIFSGASGGLLMNVLDLAKWDAGLNTERILKRSSLEAMWTPLPLDDGSAYPDGIGWFIANAKGHRVVFHTGGGPGFCAAISRYLDDRLTIIVMTNIGEGEAHADVIKIIGEIAGIYLPDTKGANPIKDW
jgi:CubicO group peptidase (beta-lactamase class C family)